MKDQSTSDCARILKQVSTIEPPREVLQRAIERTREALDSSNPTTKAQPVTLRRDSGRFLRTFAASAAVLTVAFGGIFSVFVAPSGATSAFAQVQSALEKVLYVSCSVEVHKSPQNVVSKSGTTLVDLIRNRSRFESADGEDIYVIDGKRGVSMMLYPNQKRAVVMQNQSRTELPSFLNFLEGLRNCDDDLVEQVEDTNFAGRKVERYRIPPEAPISGGVEMFVSVDPKTRLPVRIEFSTDLFGELHCGECNNFSYDSLDPILFETDLPQGYHVDGPMDSTIPIVASPIEAIDPPAVNMEPQAAELLEATAAISPTVQTSVVEFRLADTIPSDIYTLPVILDTGIKVFLHKDALLTLDDIADVKISRRSDRTELLFKFENDGAKRLEIATQQNIGKKLAFVLNGKVVVAPTINSRISTSARIEGDFSDETLSRLIEAFEDFL